MPHMKQIERTERNIPSGINRGNNRERERERLHNDRAVRTGTTRKSKNMRLNNSPES